MLDQQDKNCLVYTYDSADDSFPLDLLGSPIIKKNTVLPPSVYSTAHYVGVTHTIVLVELPTSGLIITHDCTAFNLQV